MEHHIAIYLAGSIKKDHEKSDDSFWSDKEMYDLKSLLAPHEVSFLNPAFRGDDLSDQCSVFGRDMLQVFSCDFVFVDVRERRGLGVGAEMMWAKLNKIPVIALAPKNSHYHKSETTVLETPVKDWVHPFVESLSDKIVETLAEGAAWILEALSDPSITIKDMEFIEAAMCYYKKHQLKHDAPMQEILSFSPTVNNRIRYLSTPPLVL
ncbi:MAG: hypothetical protein KGZ39_05170 [Simkania sp.]|nr:hypothetical protein [Simkania sp.]